MKLREKPSGKLLVDYRLPDRLSIGIEIGRPGKFSNLLEVTLPDMGIYNVIALGGYNKKWINENKHIVKFVGNIKFKPQFIETIFKALGEKE
jgi:hypothetical protein